MLDHLELTLSPEEIAALSSEYISQGLKKEAWKFQKIGVKGEMMTATVSMTSTSVSPTDQAGFHLSMFIAQEILGQMSNIYLHLAAGLKTKRRESWIRECRFNYRNVIRDPNDIKIEMKAVAIKKVGDSHYGSVDCRITDSLGGEFTCAIKGLLR